MCNIHRFMWIKLLALNLNKLTERWIGPTRHGPLHGHGSVAYSLAGSEWRCPQPSWPHTPRVSTRCFPLKHVLSRNRPDGYPVYVRETSGPCVFTTDQKLWKSFTHPLSHPGPRKSNDLIRMSLIYTLLHWWKINHTDVFVSVWLSFWFSGFLPPKKS